MSLTEDDLDHLFERLGDKIKLAVHDEIDACMRQYIIPLEKRVGALENAQGFLKGAAWLCGALFAAAALLLASGK